MTFRQRLNRWSHDSRVVMSTGFVLGLLLGPLSLTAPMMLPNYLGVPIYFLCYSSIWVLARNRLYEYLTRKKTETLTEELQLTLMSPGQVAWSYFWNYYFRIYLPILIGASISSVMFLVYIITRPAILDIPDWFTALYRFFFHSDHGGNALSFLFLGLVGYHWFVLVCYLTVRRYFGMLFCWPDYHYNVISLLHYFGAIISFPALLYYSYGIGNLGGDGNKVSVSAVVMAFLAYVLIRELNYFRLLSWPER